MRKETGSIGPVSFLEHKIGFTVIPDLLLDSCNSHQTKAKKEHGAGFRDPCYRRRWCAKDVKSGQVGRIAIHTPICSMITDEQGDVVSNCALLNRPDDQELKGTK